MSKHDGKTYGGYFVHKAYAETLASGNPKLVADVECIHCGLRARRSISAIKGNKGGCEACSRKATAEKPAATKHPLYVIWRGMHSRCTNKRSSSYRNYGARGIAVCKRWDRFSAFVGDMGPRPSSAHSIDRIDVDGDYAPENCRWATPEEQANNRRDTVWVEFQGERLTPAQWSRRLGVASDLRAISKKYNRTLESVISAFVEAVEAGKHTKPAAALGIVRSKQTKDEALARERRKYAELTAARNARRAAKMHKLLNADIFDKSGLEEGHLDKLLSDFSALFDENS